MEEPTLADTVVMYTHPDCSFSDALKDEFNESGKLFEEINLALNPEKWPELEELTGGERITPVLIENGEVSVGFHGVG